MAKGLCEICNPKQWKTISADMLTETGYPVYGANGIIGYYTNYNHEQPTILITCRGATCGTLNICKPFSYVNGNAMALDNLSEEINIQYLYYFLLSRGLSDVITGSAQPQIVRKSLEKVEVTYPTLDEQRKIAAVLDRVSDLIAKRRRQLAKLDELVKSRFIEMFGEPVRNSMNLPTVQGMDVFKLANGKFVPESRRFESGIPAYGGNGISWYTDAALMKNDTIVIGRVGFQSGNVHFAKGPLWITDNAMYISNFNADKCDLFFLYALMEHIDFTRFQDAGDLKKITQKPFMSMKYIMPVLSQQREYVAFVKAIDKSKAAIQKSLETLETLKKALMQQYFG